MPGTRRSKGCVTCISRKVRCDELKPFCSRCQDAGRICGGYERGKKFVDEGPRLRRARKHDMKIYFKDFTPLPPEIISTPHVPQHICHASQQDDTYIHHLRVKLFSGHCGYSKDADYDVHVFIDECLTSPLDSAPQAIRALAAVFFARMHGSPRSVMNRAALYYGMALNSLNAQLQDPATRLHSATTATAMALNVYEVVAQNADNNWVSHAGGIGRLMEIRGPETFQDFPEHGHFLLSRMMIFSQAMSQGQQTFLATPEWKSIPWRRHPETKSELHKLFDILVCLPGLQYDWGVAQRLAHAGGDAQLTLDKLEQRVYNLYTAIVAWRMRWEEENPGVVKTIAVDPKIHSCVDKEGNALFPTILWYDNIYLALDILLYNNIQVILMIMSKALGRPDMLSKILAAQHSPSTLRPTNGLNMPNGTTTFREVVEEIYCSNEYISQPEHSSIAAWSLVGPLRINVLLFVKLGYPLRYRQWLQSQLDRIATNSGFEMIRRLRIVAPLNIGTPADVEVSVGDDDAPRKASESAAQAAIDAKLARASFCGFVYNTLQDDEGKSP